MSRWWPETVAVRVAAPVVSTATLADFAPTPRTATPASAGGLRAERALREFEQRIEGLQLPRRTRVCAWLGHDIARLLMVPWAADLQSPGDRAAFAHHCFVETFGSAAKDWRVQVSDARPGRPALACGVDVGLVDGIAAVLGAHGLRLTGVRPLIMEAFNRDARRLREAGNGWLAIAESDWLTVLRLGDGEPLGVHTVARGEQPLALLLEREARLAGQDAARGSVWMVRPSAAADAKALEPTAQMLRHAGWSFQWLDALHDAMGVLPDRLAA